MGNNPSSATHKEGAAGQHRHAPKSNPQQPKRRESSHGAPPGPTPPKATPAPPSASLESALAQPTLTASASNSPSQPRDIVQTSHSRSRSSTSATQATEAIMGNEPSKTKRNASRSNSIRDKPSPHRQPPELLATSPVPKPVDAPTGNGADDKVTFVPSPLDPTAPAIEAYNLPPASFSRPPRLPLPIEEELHTPGSPILSPSVPVSPDAAEAEGHPLDEEVNRRGSVVSSTVDEEEEPDEFQGYNPTNGPNVPKVPTVIEWRDGHPTDKVYVTGTFMNWEKKYRLHWNGPSKHPNSLSATLQLPPGTHHLKFLVNNDMTLSSHLPTTVDYGNFLVNYIEVVQSIAAPVAVPSPVPSKPMDIRTKQASEAASPMRTASPATKTGTATSSPTTNAARSSPRPARTTPVLTKKESPKSYTADIPAYLLDLDAYAGAVESPESSPEVNSATSKFNRANAAIMALPTPPSLPLFLNKSILNGTTPLKDDASVLILPNHTVLNHLATTNIKAGVLATSATTRYKKRFLTTIMYKPRSEDD